MPPIRVEASPMFYLINKFKFRLVQFDTSMWHAHSQLARTMLREAKLNALNLNLSKSSIISFSTQLDTLDGANVVQYLEWYFKYEPWSFKCNWSAGGCSKCAIYSVTRLVKGTQGSLSWEKILPLLENHKNATVQRQGLAWEWK